MDKHRRQKDKILHGLYFARENIDRAITCSGNQIWWLTCQSFRRGTKWQSDGFTRAVGTDEQMNETVFNRVTGEQERPLRALANDGFIRYRRKGGMLIVAVTESGAKRARKLHSWTGRIGLCYDDHKDGLLTKSLSWLAAAVIGSAITIAIQHLWK